jgi:N-acyl homoserine lactone hydrolase
VVCRVSLLKAGSLLRDEPGKILDARSSVSLIVSGRRKILVDTGLKSEGGIIIEALAQKGLEPADIDTLINTHSHIDHIGNNHLFPSATLIFPQEGDQIAPGVKIIETPGHSIDSISVVVDSLQATVLAGDALPTLSNYIKMVPPALHIDKELAISSMLKILKIADVVVPGHDNPFSISKRAYIELWD